MRVISLFPMFSKFFRKIRHILIIKGPLFWVGYGTLAAATILMCGLAGVIIGYSIELPQVEELQDIRPNVISYVYAKDQQVIGEFAVEKCPPMRRISYYCLNGVWLPGSERGNPHRCPKTSFRHQFLVRNQPWRPP